MFYSAGYWVDIVLSGASLAGYAYRESARIPNTRRTPSKRPGQILTHRLFWKRGVASIHTSAGPLSLSGIPERQKSALGLIFRKRLEARHVSNAILDSCGVFSLQFR